MTSGKRGGSSSEGVDWPGPRWPGPWLNERKGTQMNEGRGARGEGPEKTTVAYRRTVRWGGFVARLVDHLGVGAGWPRDPASTLPPGVDYQIWVWAERWSGRTQPRLILDPADDGYADWRALLDAAPEVVGAMTFEGAAGAATGPQAQWLTSGLDQPAKEEGA